MTKIHNLRKKGQPIWIDDENHIFSVVASTPFTTHLGRLAAPVQVAPLVGHWGVMHKGKVVGMTFTNVVDASLLLLELIEATPRDIHDFWYINCELSDRKVVPHASRVLVNTDRARAARRNETRSIQTSDETESL